MLNVVMLNVVILNVIMLNVIMLNVFILNAAAPQKLSCAFKLHAGDKHSSLPE